MEDILGVKTQIGHASDRNEANHNECRNLQMLTLFAAHASLGLFGGARKAGQRLGSSSFVEPNLTVNTCVVGKRNVVLWGIP